MKIQFVLKSVATLSFVVGSAVAGSQDSCGIDVTYYVPSVPIINSLASDMSSLDQVAIRCDYTAVTGRIEWPSCDSKAQTAMQILQLAKESGSRYSGVLSIDGQNVGVATSPIEGGDFSSKQVWSYGDTDNHEVSCQIDNGLKYAVNDGVDFLRQAVVHEVSAALGIDGSLPLDLDALKKVVLSHVMQQIAPLPEDASALLHVAEEMDPLITQ